ncbi:M61 family metallopeptidase [Algicola sagamiensis]|uniref:M61 family metallopeptidase n=1 Tax=Algicola sagamiensis TaxID=163869 RepID=UPI000362BC3B|nr:hypothetical protein [Algicola sagamiensis]
MKRYQVISLLLKSMKTHFICLPFLLLPFLIYSVQAKIPQVEFRFEGAFEKPQKNKLRQWLRHELKTVQQGVGFFPEQQIFFLIKRATHNREPVPWAYVERAQPPGVIFYVSPTFSMQAFLNDWTAVHEISHLLIPYPGQSGTWFTEGLATYYQNVLHARSGILSPKQAWQKIQSGFRRGLAQTKKQKSDFLQANQHMHTSRSYMRVYWTGTAFFLEADFRLRTQTPDWTLDLVLKELNTCCRHQRKVWSTELLIHHFDQISHTKIFSSQWQAFKQMKGFPDVEKWLLLQDISHRKQEPTRVISAIFAPQK